MSFGANPFGARPFGDPEQAAAGGGVTLTAENAAWQFAAQNATLRVARKLTADNAPWEFAAQSAGLTVARKITADNAAWEFAAQDATLTYTPAGAYVLTAESTGWQFAAPDATLTYTPIQGDRASGGFAWLEYISDREREEYRKKRREVYQNAPKKVTAVVKKVAQKAAIEQREPEPEEIEQAFQSEGVAYQPDYGQMAQNAYRLYLQLLINRRKLEQEAEKEREQTRQFIAEQTRIALEDQQRRAQLIEEEAVFMAVAALLLD